MAPDISEFSYGFALTNEIVTRFPGLATAPVFPSLLQEGKEGGGYDLKLGDPTFPIFLQFKLSHKMLRRSCAEIKTHHLPINVPFYRFPLMDSRHSKQHDMLLSLDQAGSEVFYAAPRFHTHEELDAAFRNNSVAQESRFVRPRTIGALQPGKHHCTLAKHRVYVCSEPREVEYLDIENLESYFRQTLEVAGRALDEHFVNSLLEAFSVAAEKMSDQDKSVLRAYDRYSEGLIQSVTSTRGVFRPIRLRYDELLTSLRRSISSSKKPFEQLSKVSEFASNVFGVQLFVVQERHH